jgi:hypothetical protein
MHEPEWSVAPLEPFNWAPRAGGAPGAHPPNLGGPYYHPNHVLHTIHTALDVTHIAGVIAEMYEIFPVLGHHGAVAAVAGVAAPLGSVALVGLTFLELYHAGTTHLRIEAQKGVCYGLMAEVLGTPDVAHTTKPAPFEDTTVPLSQAECEAYEEGVREGREQAKDPAVREAIVKALAFEMAAQGRTLDTDPQHHAWHKAVDNTLNRLWDGTHEKLSPLQGSRIPWEGQQDGFPKEAPKP